MTYKKKLIEVALPLEAINIACSHEKSIRQGHPSTLHLWWARRPLAAARAVIFAQMVDDPSAHPDIFPTEKAQEKERQRLFRIIEDLVQWENTTNENVLQQAREEIWQSWRYTCAENVDHPRAKELFDRYKLPAFHDPFAGGGALPLEAQRLGLETWASDLNPVAVLINKAMIEIPSRFAKKSPVNPEAIRQSSLIARDWSGGQGLAEDVRYYGQWMRNEAERRIGSIFPKIEITAKMAEERHDLQQYVGQKLTIIAWIWARTVKSPNPAFAQVDVPLASSFMLSTNKGKEAYIQPVIDDGRYWFTVKVGKPEDPEAAKNGTKLPRANFICLMSGTPISVDYIRSEGKAGRIGVRLMAIVADGEQGRIYLPPIEQMEVIAHSAKPKWSPEIEFFQQALGFRVGNYGMTMWSDLFTNRQLVALTTFSELVQDAREKIRQDALLSGLSDDDIGLANGGTGARSYAEAIGVYLAFTVDKLADLANNLCMWEPIAQCPRHLFGRQTISMNWSFAEGNPLGESSGAWLVLVNGISKAIAKTFEFVSSDSKGFALQADASRQQISMDKIVSMDPPYYDNIGFADLSDFFYVWLRNSQRDIFPDIFETLAVPKNDELVATPERHGGIVGAERFFLEGMTQVMHRLADQTHPLFPITIYYAYRQSEGKSESGTTSTGWETFLEAVIQSGFSISGTWPIRTENDSRLRGQTSNALASSIVLVCRRSAIHTVSATRGEFVMALKEELPKALAHLQVGNIAPVDLAQAAIGPGMAVFTRYTKVLNAEGKSLTIREALALINQTLDEVLTEQEGDFDSDTRWAVAWFQQVGFNEDEYGVAETLSKAKDTSIDGMTEAGILVAGRGKVRLLKPNELPKDWDPTTDKRLTTWEMVHHLIRTLESGGESAAAELMAQLGAKAETARELCYRLYTICERKKRAAEALSYNALVQSWPEITRLAREISQSRPSQPSLFQ